MIRKLIASIVVACATTVGAQAALLELGLAIDGSGSIGTTDFNLQRQGYVNALTDLLPTDGTVAVGVWVFGSSVSQVFNEQIIDSAAKKAALITSISNLVYPNGSSTALGPAITNAAARLLQNDIVGDRQVIDVSTDGFGNSGINQVTARDNALAAGIEQINGLLVGSSASSTFVGGTGSFSIAADTFADFEAALRRKLTIEITGGVPDAGSTLAMLGIGCVTIAGLRRRFA